MNRKIRGISWQQAYAKKIFTKIPPNRRVSIQLLHVAEIREDFLREPLHSGFALLRLEAYYDIIKELILAHLAKKGWECKNYFALPLYVEKHFHEFKKQATIITKLFAIKKNIHTYDKEKISEYIQKNEEALRETIEILKERVDEK